MVNNCNICQSLSSKYKCPTCRIFYCSVECYKKHKEYPDKCKETKMTESICNIHKNYNYITTDTVDPKILHLLDCKKMKDLLYDSQLQHILIMLNNSSHPEKDIQAAMMNSVFTNFVDICLNIVEPQTIE